ncbi:hypothetical protein V7024_01555 [Bacillus sp. JJ864]|uniref:hypothetical protein n=1 Tax=Bacillus sp. JJ864 TaxID=3122975 RepID=UPI002FFDAB64
MKNDKEKMLELAKAMGLDVREVEENEGGFFIEGDNGRKKVTSKDTIDLFYTQDELEFLRNNELKWESLNKTVTFAKKTKVTVDIASQASFFIKNNTDSKVVA